ncbi:hypothetical protein M422DRAFT_271401 [Sphaerobolus stellatus SS14]|uniref:Uncharacterized protein n=1 Tax=Sphaerobolus stellatus (strain SS14) TaxID=990650 RepID=A0A0C9UEL1_SPHS4|nr:hypothetical protein M422DRAFT_271401 [Sphaerobolus stellatus SS14]
MTKATAPYMALLQGYRLSKVPLPSKIENLLQLIHTDGIYPDMRIINDIIEAYTSWGLYDKALNMYTVATLTSSTSPVNGITFRRMFILLRILHTNKHPLFHFLPMRTLFRDSLAFKIRSSATNFTATWNAALEGFMNVRDYAAAINVIDQFWIHKSLPDMITKDVVELGLLTHVRESLKEGTGWRIKFLGDGRNQRFSRRLQYIRLEIQKQGLEGHPATLQYLRELLFRALQAQLGHFASWGEAFTPTEKLAQQNQEKAEKAAKKAIEKAAMDMMPADESISAAEPVDESDNLWRNQRE